MTSAWIPVCPVQRRGDGAPEHCPCSSRRLRRDSRLGSAAPKESLGDTVRLGAQERQTAGGHPGRRDRRPLWALPQRKQGDECVELPGVGRQEGRASHHVCWRPPRAARPGCPLWAAGMRYPLEPVVTRDSVQGDEIKTETVWELNYPTKVPQTGSKRTNPARNVQTQRPCLPGGPWTRTKVGKSKTAPPPCTALAGRACSGRVGAR